MKTLQNGNVETVVKALARSIEYKLRNYLNKDLFTLY
jgi:hypothetical protein